MVTRVDTRHLRRHVVRLDSRAGAVLGTGFFAAPGMVVTCAHVVRDTDEVVAVPADRSVSGHPVPAVVVARSLSPPGGAGLWPFPDLAVLRLGVEVDHPCVLLAGQDPVGGEVECQAWGYPRREYGQVPPGSPASFRFEGVEGDGFLTLKAGQAVPGLSGAPLVCPGRRAVVGVMAATRDEAHALGGYAAPVAALWDTGLADLPGELAEAGASIRRHNRPAVVRARAGWHRVLPVDGTDETLDQPWETFVRRPKSSPADLLRADFGVVPYLFRDGEVDEAVAWCEAADGVAPLAVCRVAGLGGSGKTRFAIEVCRRLAGSGWLAGWWKPGGGVARVPVPRLVVVDYAEAESAEDLRSMLDGFRRQATDVAPVRVLVLTRTGAGGAADPLEALREHAPAVLRTILDMSIDSDAAATKLTATQRRMLFTEADGRFRRAWSPAAPEHASGPPPALTADRYATTPLEVLFEAFDRALSGREWHPGTRPAVDRVLAHEQKYWKATAPGGLDRNSPLLDHSVALATLAGAVDDAEADELLALLPGLHGNQAARRQVAAWLAGLYEGPLLLNPLRPDRLGEAATGHLLRDIPGGGRQLLGALFALRSDDQVARCLDGLARLASGDTIAAEITQNAMLDCHVSLVRRAEHQSTGSPDRPARTLILAGLLRLLGGGGAAAIAGRLADAEPGNTTYQRDLSVSYNKLADLAVATGQTDEAHRLYTESLTIRERLADAEPGNTTYQRDLSVSYDNLADLAVATGQTDEAHRLYTESLTIARRLADAEPGNTTYQRDLSVSYERLGARAEEEGNHDEAAQYFSKAVGKRRALHHQEPERVDLAEELAVALALLGDAAPQKEARREIAAEIRLILGKLEERHVLTRKGNSVSRWIRDW